MSLTTSLVGITGLRGLWVLDDGTGTNANDSGSGNHDGTTGSLVKRTAAGLGGIPGKASQTGYGSSGSITVPHHADFDVCSGSFSIVFALRLWGFEDAGFALKVNGFPGAYIAQSLVGSDWRPQLRVWGGNTVCTGSPGITDIHRWHLVIITWNGTVAKIYVDGVDVSGATTTPSPSFADGGGEDLLVGSDSGRLTLSHVALYTGALSAGNVTTLQAAFAADNVETNLSPFEVGIHQELLATGTKGVRDNSILRMRALHATRSRNVIYWGNVEASAGVFDWSRLDDIFDELEENEMEMHACIASSPTWANGGATGWDVPGTGVDGSFNTWLALYEDWVETLVTRYAGRIERYELWNEPNLIGFWSNAGDVPDAAQYRAWHNAIRAVILGLEPAAKICFAGLSSWSAVGAGITGETFFRACMAAGAMTINNFAYHPYVGSDSDPDTFLTVFDNTFHGDIRHIRDVLLEFGYNVPIWLTEFGWPSAGGANTETTQRDRLQNALEGVRDEHRSIVDYVVPFIDYDQSGFTFGLHSDMPSDGSAPDAKLAAAMFSTFADPFDEEEGTQILVPRHAYGGGCW